jgi:hypothetical protein
MSHNRQSSAPLPQKKKDKLTSSISHESLNHPFSCPICEEEMISLAQLNQHLDDAHTSEKEPKDGLQWFRKPLKQFKNINEKGKSKDNSFTGIKERVLKRSESTETASLIESSSSLGFISLLTSNKNVGEQVNCTKCNRAMGLLYGRVQCLL